MGIICNLLIADDAHLSSTLSQAKKYAKSKFPNPKSAQE
jgi:hypothetical protein